MDPKHQYSGFPDDCSKDQLKKLIQFRKIVQLLKVSDMYDDAYLLRFLRARKFDLIKTEQMFKNFLKWRQQKQVQLIFDFQFKQLQHVRKYYPHGYYKTDKLVFIFYQGRPVYIQQIGKLNVKQLFKKTTKDRMLKYYTKSYQTLIKYILPICSEKANKRIDQTVTILDLNGLGFGMLSSQNYNFVKLTSSIAQDNYPQVLGKMFIINAPFIFKTAWVCIKPWLDQKTTQKIQLHGSNGLKNLLELVIIIYKIPSQNLPDFLGGTSTEKLEENPGPWKKHQQFQLFQINKQEVDEVYNRNRLYIQNQ